MGVNNIYSVGVDIRPAKKAFDELFDQYEELSRKIGQGIGTEGFSEQIEEMKSAIAEIAKSLTGISKTKVNNETFGSFSKDITGQIDSLNARTTVLEETVGKLISTMSEADGGSFKKWIASVKKEVDGLNLVAEKTTDIMRNVATQNSTKQPIKLVDSNTVAETKAELQDLIKRINALQDTARESEIINISSITNAKKQLKGAINEAEALKKTLSNMSISDTDYSSIQLKYVSALERVYDISGSVQEKFGDIGDSAINKLVDSAVALTDHLDPLINNVQAQIRRLTSISIPIDISTTTKELKDKVASIISTLQSTASKKPIEIEFVLVSSKRYRDFGEALKVFQQQIEQIPHEADRAAMESIAEDLRSGMVNQINFGIKTSLADAAVAARSIIAKIRSELKNEPIVIEPEIKLGKEQIENYTAEINALSERLSNIVTDAVGKGLAARKTDSSGGTGDSLTVLKRRTSELSVLLNKTLPESVLKFNKDLKLLDENKMGSANAKALADNLNLAYSALKKILDLASNNNSLFNLLSDWRESDLILEQFKDRKAMLERSAILGSDNKIYGGYVYDKHGGTVGSNYTKLPSGVSAVTDIHSHSSDHIAALSNVDIEAWAYDVVNKGIKDALVVAIDDVEHFYAADFFNEAKGRGVDFNDQDIQNTLKDNFSLMLKHIKEHSLEFLYDAIEKYGGITLGDFANKFAKPIEDYWGSEGFHFDSNLFVNAFKEIVDGGDYKDAVEAVNAALVNSIKNQAGKSLTLKDVKDVTQYLNIPEMMGLSKFFEDPRNLFTYQVRRLTPMTFNGGFGKDLGVGDLFEKYIHYYTHDEFKEANPLNLSSSQFDGLFKNTGVESFVKNIEQAVAALEPLTKITSALSNISGGDSLQNLIPEELVTNVTTVATSLSQLTEILGETGSIKIDTSPLKDLSKTLYELSDVVQRYTGLSSASNLESAFADIKTTASAISNLDFRRKESKNAVLELVEQYYDYLRRGGTSGVGEITENKSLKAQINKIYDDSIAQSARAAAEEAPAINQVKISATDAAGAKKQFAEANGQLLESIVKSLDGLNNEGKAFENLNKLLNNLGGKNGDVKLEKTKKALETIYNVMNSSIGADSFIKELENLASSGDALKDLADVIKASKSQVSSASKAIKGDEIETRRNQSQELIRDYAADLKAKAEDELKALYGKEVPYLSLQIDRQGFIEATGYIKDLGASAEELQVVKMRLDEAGDFITTSLSSANVQAMKYQQFLDKLHAAAKLPDHITDEIVFDKNTDSDVWSVLLDHAQQYYGFIGNLQKVTRQVRQDAAGNLLESFTFLGDKGHVTMGREGDEVASHQDLINLQEIVDRYQKLISISQKYYELKYKNAEGRASEYEVRAIQDVEDEYKRLIALVQEVNNTATIGKDNIAQKAFESFNNDFNRNFDQALDAKIQAFQKSLTKQEITRSNQRNEFTTAFQNEINQAKEAISVIRSLRESYANGQMFWSDTDLKTVFEGLEKMQSVMDRFQDRTGIAALTSDVDKLITKIQTDLNNNNIKGNLRDQYSDLLNTLNQVRVDSDATKDGIASIDKVTLGNLQGQFQGLHAEMLKTGQDGRGFFQQIAGSITAQSANFLARYFSIYSIIRYGKQIAQTVNQVDASLKELQKVSGATTSQINKSFETASATAQELGATITDVVNSTADWSRLGYSLPESEELARITTLYQNIAKGVDQKAASEYMVSTLQAFKISADDAEGIVDRINKVANNYAIDQAGIGESLKRSAASLHAAGADLSQAIALVTAANETVQNPESIGTMWKTLSARIRGAKTELQELGEEEDEYTETTSKLRDQVKALTGFDIMVDDTQYKNIYDIVVGIGKAWDKLTDIERASLGEALAGKRNSNAFYALMSNIEHLEGSYYTAETSAGDAAKAQEIFASSVQYSIDRAKASLQELSSDFLSADFLKGAIDAGNSFINVLDKIVNSIGTVGSLLALFGVASGVKGTLSRRGSLVGSLFNSLVANGGAIGTAKVFNKQFELFSAASAAYDLQRNMVTSGNFINALSGFTGVEEAARALRMVGVEGEAAKQWLKMAFQEADDAAIAAAVSIKSVGTQMTFVNKIGLALKGLLSNPVFWGAAAIVATIAIVKSYERHLAELRKQAVEASEEWNKIAHGMTDYKSKVDELRKKLDEGNLSEQETLDIKEEIYSIQTEILQTYGEQAEGINLINGRLEEQYAILNRISKAEADRILRENVGAFDQARKDAYEPNSYSLGGVTLNQNAKNDILSTIRKVGGIGYDNGNLVLTANDLEAEQTLISYMNELDKLKKQHGKTDDAYAKAITKAISSAQSVLTKFKGDWDNTISAIKAEQSAMFYAAGGGSVLEDLTSAAEAYNKAFVLRKPIDEIDEAREAYEEALDAKDAFFESSGLRESDYEELFSSIYDGLDKVALKYYQAQKKIQKVDRNINRQRQLQAGGTVDLLNRPMVGADKMRKAFPNYPADAYSTVDTFTFSNTSETKFANFTPIITDENGNFVDVLSEDALEEYATYILDGVDGDKFNLQIGAIFEGDNALKQAVEAAQEIHEIQEEYYSEGLISRKHQRVIADTLAKVTEAGLDRVDVSAILTSRMKGTSGIRRTLQGLAEEFGFNIGNQEELSAFIDLLVQSGYVAGDSTDAIRNTSSAYNALKNSVDTAVSSIDAINTAMSESASAAGLTEESLEKLREIYGDELGDALETSANGYHLNVTEMDKLRKKQDQLAKSDFMSALATQYSELYNAEEKLAEAVRENNLAGIENWSSGIEGIVQTINSIQDLIMKYDAATSAYKRYQDAQSNGTERDEFEKIQSGYDDVKDLIERGWVTDDTVTSYLELMTGKTITSADEVYAAMDNLSKKIGDTEYSIMDFFTVDDDGKTVTDGIYNFLDVVASIQEKAGESWVTKLADGGYSFDFGNGGDQRLADLFSSLTGVDIGVEAIQSIIRAAREAGFIDLNIEAPIKSIEELQQGAKNARDALNGLGETGLGKLDVSVGQSFDNIGDSISRLQEYIDEVNESDLSPETKTERLTYANQLLEYYIALEKEAVANRDVGIDIENIDVQINDLVSKLDELRKSDGTVDVKPGDAMYDTLEMLYTIKEYTEQPAIMNVDVSEMSGDLPNAVAKVQQLQREISKLNVLRNMQNQGIDVSARISASQESISNIASEIRGIDEEIIAKVGINPDELKEQLAEIENVNVQAGIDLPEESINAVSDMIASIDPEPVVLELETDGETNLDRAKSKLDSFKDKNVTLTIDIPNLSSKISSIDHLTTSLNNLNGKTFTFTVNRNNTVTGGSNNFNGTANGEIMANGTAHVFGTSAISKAYAGGKWGLQSNQKALINEVGPEIVVRGSNWFIPNGGRPTMNYPLKRGDIIFNAKQSKELLENGYIANGYAHSSGTAFSSGTGPGRRKKTDDKKSGSSGSDKSSNKSSDSSSKSTEETAENIKDWVEVLLNRIAKTFEDFKSMADYWTTYINKNRELNNAIDQAFKNIADNQKAYQRYMQEANKVGLSDAYKKKVQNGELNIENIKDEKLREKVEKYTEW